MFLVGGTSQKRGVLRASAKRRQPRHQGAIPNCANRNAYTSVCSSIFSDSAVPRPCPLVPLVRSNTSEFGDAYCKRAVILRDCIGSTRGSFAPVRNSVAGSLVPSLTLWYGE